MGLILFVHKDIDKYGEAFRNVIEKRFSSSEFEIVRTLDVLEAKLKQFQTDKNKELYLLLVDSEGRLEAFKPLVDLLEDKRLVMVLPADSQDTAYKAGCFYPRFFTYMGDNYDHLCAVIEKMLKVNP